MIVRSALLAVLRTPLALVYNASVFPNTPKFPFQIKMWFILFTLCPHATCVPASSFLLTIDFLSWQCPTYTLAADRLAALPSPARTFSCALQILKHPHRNLDPPSAKTCLKVFSERLPDDRSTIAPKDAKASARNAKLEKRPQNVQQKEKRERERADHQTRKSNNNEPKPPHPNGQSQKTKESKQARTQGRKQASKQATDKKKANTKKKRKRDECHPPVMSNTKRTRCVHTGPLKN